MSRRINKKRKASVGSSARRELRKRTRKQSKEGALYDGYPKSFKPSPFTEESRKKRASERRRRMIVGWPLAILSVIAMILIIVTLIAYLPQFYIERITISGLRLVDREEVGALIDKKPGEHFIHGVGGGLGQYITLRYGNIEKTIEDTFPLVRSAKVQFRFPSEVHVTIVEKTEILAVRISGGYALLDSGLYVMRMTSERDFDIPVLEGIRVQSTPVVNEKIDVDDEARLFAAINITAALIGHDQSDTEYNAVSLMQHVKQIRQLSDHVFYLFVPLSQGGEIRVRLEDNRSLQDRLKVLSYLLGEGDLRSRGSGELDLTGQSVFFRPDAT
ncbi:MAG TPA: FtsQ-type POTRA domain-containing protein [Clostridiaceae bacterium]|nr:FtsQ-type POTRA domain-containing protein [Clostridiaceae bacterium]